MKIGLLSLGCPKNLVDGEVMLGLAQHAGHEPTADATDADVLIVNTCAFIDSAKQESIDAILEMAAHKRDGRCRRLVVTGCLAERYGDELLREIPEIDAVLGTGEVPEIVAAIGRSEAPRLAARGSLANNQDAAAGSPDATAAGSPHAKAAGKGGSTVPLRFFARGAPAGSGRRATIPVDAGGELPATGREFEAVAGESRAASRAAPSYIYDAETPRLLTTPAHFAYVKIAEGCDYTCAFCIIPTLRGTYRSRTSESIVREARALAARGVRELLLVSQDTTFYGIDRGERGALARLLRELNAIDGLTWIRLLYLYPTTITDDVLAAMAECEKVCRYVDLPLQHASPAVLKRMRRPGTRKSYDALLARIRATVPGVTLRSTLIVGFPGETDADFAELDGFVADTGFDHLGVFTYSHEEGTRAHSLEDDVPAAVKARRRNALMARQKKIVARRQKATIGSEVALLVDGPSPEHEMVIQARLEGQAPDIDSVVYLTDCDAAAMRAGDLIRGRIVAARGYDLVAAPL